MTRLPLLLTIPLVVGAIAVGCDDDESPEVTFGQQRTDQQPVDEPDLATEDETDEADEGDETDKPNQPVVDDHQHSVERHMADLPSGTAEQQSQLIEGRKAFLNDQFQEAAEVFEELAFDEPITADTISAAVALGQIYIETGRPDEALDLFERLEDHVNEVPEVLLVLARTYENLDEPRQAIEAYERAYEAKPDYIFILPEMAEILVREGDEDRAGEILVRYEANVAELANHLEDPESTSVEERVYIADIFAMISDERAHDALEVALDDDSERVRAQAAIALGEGAAFDARALLEETATDDESESVRQAARRALEQLRDFERQFDEVTAGD